MRSEFLGGRVVLYGGDSREVLKGLADASIDSVVCDPPYALVSIVKRYGKEESHLHVAEHKDLSTIKAAQYNRLSGGFMGKKWDTGEAAFAVTFWAEIMRVLKPGGHVVAFSGTRTYHRLACAIEDAGFEIRDQLAWAYGSGFPKSHDVSKGIDKAAGHWRGRAGAVKEETVGQVAKGTEYERTDKGEPITDPARQWRGWGTALKPAWEPIVLARKLLAGTVAANVLAHGTGALNIDGCRVGDEVMPVFDRTGGATDHVAWEMGTARLVGYEARGRWPANIVHDGSDEVVAAFPETGVSAGGSRRGQSGDPFASVNIPGGATYADSGSAARFFYSAKADKTDRMGSGHPTVKPVDLMQWLCRLVTPPGGVVLDPFAGSGSTGEAAWREGFNAILIEREEEYQKDIAARLELADAGPMKRKARAVKQVETAGPLFGADNDNTGVGGQTHLRDVCGPITGLSGQSASSIEGVNHAA